MAEFNRSLSTPAEARNRTRSSGGHVSTCPRCRVDPSHISRQFWEATRPPPNATVADIPAGLAEQSTLPQHPNEAPLRVGYPPDLCRNRPRGANVHHPQSRSGYYNNAATSTSNSTSGGVMRYSDTHSTRSAGDTWRIRGILENYQPEVRRPESSTGRLPDVTQHQVSSSLHVQHARTRSVPVGGVYDARVPSSSGYDLHQVLHQQIPRNRNQDTASVPAHRPSTSQRQDGASSSAAVPPTHQWKRDHQSNSPWVTRDATRQPVASTSSSSTWPGSHQQQQQQQQPSSSSCWRPASASTSNQCPLPDLVTPRRQARKQCCGLLATHSVAIRWLVVVVAALGLLCSIVGTIVGVVKASGREHLTVALLLIGLGIVLVSMSGVAWRLTSRDSPSCRDMFGLRRTRHEPHRRFVPRVPHYGRPHPFSAMLYPDISLRPPPPSYQASMQEYRLRLLLMDRQVATTPPSHPSPPQPPPPPPIYRGPTTVYPRFPVGISDYSRPPSYRSRPSSAGQPSPVGPEDAEINNTSTSTHHLPSDVSILTASSAPSTQAAPPMRSAPSTAATNNHVEVVAQV